MFLFQFSIVCLKCLHSELVCIFPKGKRSSQYLVKVLLNTKPRQHHTHTSDIPSLFSKMLLEKLLSGILLFVIVVTT